MKSTHIYMYYALIEFREVHKDPGNKVSHPVQLYLDHFKKYFNFTAVERVVHAG